MTVVTRAALTALLICGTYAKRRKAPNFSPAALVSEPERKEIQITLESADEVADLALAIFATMGEQHLHRSDWFPKVNEMVSSVNDTTTFPRIVTVPLLHYNDVDAQMKQELGASLVSVGDEIHEDPDDGEDPHEHGSSSLESVSDEDPDDDEDPVEHASSLLSLSFEEARRSLEQFHTQRFGTLSDEERAVANQNTALVGQDLDDMEHEDLINVLRRARKKKNQKQRDWAGKAIAKLESEVCTRSSKFRMSRSRKTWLKCCHNLVVPYFETEACHAHEVAGPIECLSKCGEGWEPGTLGTCIELCDIPSLQEHMNTRCDGYCTRDTGACVAKYAKMTLAMIDMVSNFIPGARSLALIRTAAQKSRAALKVAIKKAAREIAKRLRQDAKRKLRRYMKKEAKELREDLLDALVEGGAESVAEVVIAHTESGAVQKAAEDLVKAVDPTGIIAFIEAFETDTCESKKILNMPVDDLVEEVCPDTIHFSGSAAAMNIQHSRLTTFDYVGEDQDNRPIYANDQNQFLFYYDSWWLIGADSTRGLAGIHNNGHGLCPTSSQNDGKWEWFESGKGWTSGEVHVTD